MDITRQEFDALAKDVQDIKQSLGSILKGLNTLSANDQEIGTAFTDFRRDVVEMANAQTELWQAENTAFGGLNIVVALLIFAQKQAGLLEENAVMKVARDNFGDRPPEVLEFVRKSIGAKPRLRVVAGGASRACALEGGAP